MGKSKNKNKKVVKQQQPKAKVNEAALALPKEPVTPAPQTSVIPKAAVTERPVVTKPASIVKPASPAKPASVAKITAAPVKLEAPAKETMQTGLVVGHKIIENKVLWTKILTTIDGVEMEIIHYAPDIKRDLNTKVQFTTYDFKGKTSAANVKSIGEEEKLNQLALPHLKTMYYSEFAKLALKGEPSQVAQKLKVVGLVDNNIVYAG